MASKKEEEKVESGAIGGGGKEAKGMASLEGRSKRGGRGGSCHSR
jgi:hypothetical protein